MPGHAGPGFGAVRSFSRDNSVTRQQLAPGTLRRVGAFARPYRGRLAAFVGLILVEAALGASVPLVYREIIDGGMHEFLENFIIENNRVAREIAESYRFYA